MTNTVGTNPLTYTALLKVFPKPSNFGTLIHTILDVESFNFLYTDIRDVQGASKDKIQNLLHSGAIWSFTIDQLLEDTVFAVPKYIKTFYLDFLEKTEIGDKFVVLDPDNSFIDDNGHVNFRRTEYYLTTLYKETPTDCLREIQGLKGCEDVLLFGVTGEFKVAISLV
jgi:hypothetical protein